MLEKFKLKKIYTIYIALFIFIACIVFSIFFVNNYTFIWQLDGMKQHYIILKNFNEIIRNFLSAQNGEGLQLFSWNMGLGLDVIGQYSYYILGDPFAYISLLFPMEKLEIAYMVLILLRIFFIGISFIVYAKYNKQNDTNILLGAIIYTFCSFTLYAGVRHPYFLNAMILFPMLLLGVDKLFKENKKVFLCTFIAISAICSYYFFYMHTIMLVIYAVIKYICEYRKEGIKFFFNKLLAGIIIYIIGILIASIILLPTIYAFLNSARSTEETICKYEIQYYEGLFTICLLNCYGQYWSYIGVSSIILIMIPILWNRRKENRTYFVYLIILTIFLLVPFLGSMMNGFSFPNNRWSFIYSFVLSYIVTLSFDCKYSLKEKRDALMFLCAYSLLIILAILRMSIKKAYITFLIQIIITFIMFLILIFEGCNEKITNSKFKQRFKLNKRTILIFILTIASIEITAYGLYSSYDRNYAKEFIKFGNIDNTISTQAGRNKSYEHNIKNILQEDSGFYRIAKTIHSVHNLSIYYNYHSIEDFLSIGNKYVYDLSKDLKDARCPSYMDGWGDRTKITTLLGTKYYLTDEKGEKNIPYGYNLKENIEGVKTYENKFPLSIGVAYNEYLLKEEYEKLSPLEKEDTILKVAVIENEEDLKGLNLEKREDLQDIIDSSYSVTYEVIDENKILTKSEEITKEVAKENKEETTKEASKENKEEAVKETLEKNKEGQTLEKNIIVTTDKNQKIELNIPEIKNSELYVYITGFEFNGNNEHKVTAKFNDKTITKTIENKITSAYYVKTPELLFPLGYYEKTQGKIELSFSTKGTYDYDTIEVLAVPMNSYEKSVKKLQENELKDVKYNSKEVIGKINLKEDSILQISTGYTIGWKAYIDGEKEDTIKVNTAFIGIPVKQGEHEIVLKYEVPFLKLAIICSVIGIISFVILVVIEKKRIKEN